LLLPPGGSVPFAPAIPGIDVAEQWSDVSIDPTDFSNELLALTTAFLNPVAARI
jgi:hypothetical protein